MMVKVVLLQAKGGILRYNLLHIFICNRYNTLTTSILYTARAKLKNFEPKDFFVRSARSFKRLEMQILFGNRALAVM